MSFYMHPQAIVDSSNIGDETRVWAFAHVLAGATIGKNCNICDHVFIENNVIIGDNVTVKCGVYIWDGVRISSNVFVGPNVTFTNDLRPRSTQYPKEYLQTLLEEGASIGANATIIAGNKIGRYAMVGAGSVVTKDIPAHTLWYGNPARFQGYVCTCGQKLDENLRCLSCDTQYVRMDGEMVKK